MGKYQDERLNPEIKRFYSIPDLNGGINTEDSDDNAGDNQFYELLNFDMDKNGTIQKRKGFGRFDALTQILNLYSELPQCVGKSEDDPNPEDTNDNVIYMKLLKNDNNVFRNLSEYTGEDAYRDYQIKYGFQNNTFELFMITTNGDTGVSHSWLFECTLPTYVSGADTIVTTLTKTELPIVFPYEKRMINFDVIEFYENLYFVNNEKCLMIYDILNKSYKYCGGEIDDISGMTNESYKPTPMEVSKIGFNVLGTDPLYWVSYPNISTDSIQGVYLSVSSSKPVLVIPQKSEFMINILHTGETNNTFDISFKEGDETIDATVTKNLTLSQAGLAVYDVELASNPTSELEIKIEKIGSTLSPYYDYYQVGEIDNEQKEVESLNAGEYNILEMYNRAVYYGKNSIWFSQINNFSYVPNYNYVDLPLDPEDEITKIVYFKNMYVVFTKYRIYKMTGQFGTDAFQLQPLNTSIGCHAPQTIQTVDNYLYFTCKRGIYTLISNTYYEGMENVRELDTQIKSLTSDYAISIAPQLDVPNVRFNGISEKAFAVRYKNKYMLFLNDTMDDSNYDKLENIDVLVYYYNLKSYSSINFKTRPPFLFLANGVLESYITTPVTEDYTDPNTLFEYDNVNENDLTGRKLLDKSGNDNDADLIGSAIVMPIYGLSVPSSGVGDEKYAKLGSVNSNIYEGIKAEVNMAFPYGITPTAGDCVLLDLKSNTPMEKTESSSGNILISEYTSGLKSYMYYKSYPDSANDRTRITYEMVLRRSSSSIISGDEATMVLTDSDDTVLASHTGDVNFVNNRAVIGSGFFFVDHDVNDEYSDDWNLETDCQAGTERVVSTPGADTTLDTTKFASWDTSEYYGIRYDISASQNANGALVTVRTYFKFKYDLYIGARTLTTYIDGQAFTQNIPAISHDGGNSYYEVGGATHTKQVNYEGSGKTITIDGDFDIRATLNGVYRPSVAPASFSFGLPISGTETVIDYTEIGMVINNEFTLNKLIGNTDNRVGLNFNFDSQEFTLNTSGLGLDSSIVIPTPTAITVYRYNNYGVLLEIFEEDDLIKAKIGVNMQGGDYIYSDSFELDPLSITDEIVNRDNNSLGGEQSWTCDFAKIENDDEVFFEYDFSTVSTSQIVDKNGENFGLYGDTTPNRYSAVYSGYKDEEGYIKLNPFDSSVKLNYGFSITCNIQALGGSNGSTLIDLSAYGESDKSRVFIRAIPETNNVEFVIINDSYKVSRLLIEDYTYTSDEFGYITFSCEYVEDNEYLMKILYRSEIITKTIYKSDIPNATLKHNYIGKNVDLNAEDTEAVFQSIKFEILASNRLVPIYENGMYEYEYTYDEYNKPMYFKLESRATSMKYPMHLKKLKKALLKVTGGIAFQEFSAYVKADGHPLSQIKSYNIYVDEVTGEVKKEEIDVKDLKINESSSTLGSMRLGVTKVGNTTYELLMISQRGKGKNLGIVIEGESSNYFAIENISYIFKIGKIKEG